jgi:hypothetical protein
VNTPIYPCPVYSELRLTSLVGYTFYGILRDGGVLKGIDDDLGVTPLVRLNINSAFSASNVGPTAGPGWQRMSRDLYWEWYWTKYREWHMDEP